MNTLFIICSYICFVFAAAWLGQLSVELITKLRQKRSAKLIERSQSEIVYTTGQWLRNKATADPKFHDYEFIRIEKNYHSSEKEFEYAYFDLGGIISKRKEDTQTLGRYETLKDKTMQTKLESAFQRKSGMFEQERENQLKAYRKMALRNFLN